MDPDQAVDRINERVSRGGHFIPKETVERRFHRSVELLFNVYHKLADSVFIFDNSNGNANLIASKKDNEDLKILNKNSFKAIFGERSFNG